MKDRILPLLHAVDRWLPERISGLLRRLVDKDILASASSLAFYGLVSALPLLVITFAVVEAAAGGDTLRRFADQVSQSGPRGTGQFVEQLASDGGSLTFVTLLLAIWPATAYGGGLRRALTRHADRSETIPAVRGRLLALGMVLVLPVIVLAGIPLMFFLTTLSGDGALATVLGWVLALVVGTALATAMTSVLYKMFTPGGLETKKALAGAALTATFTTLFSLAFVLYLQVGDPEERFGGGMIAVVVLLGVWLFVANSLLLGGFESVLEFEGVLDDE